jgi:hypothetical protein
LEDDESLLPWNFNFVMIFGLMIETEWNDCKHKWFCKVLI